MQDSHYLLKMAVHLLLIAVFMLSGTVPAYTDFVLLSSYFGDAIYKAPLNCMKEFRFQEVPIEGITIDGPRSISFDPVDKKIYWIERVSERIGRCNLDGSNVEEVVTGIRRPYGLDLDVENRRVYWTQLRPNANGINYINMNLTGRGIVPNSNTGPRKPRGLAFGKVTGSIYIGFTQSEPQIMRFSHDGSRQETLIGPGDDVQNIAELFVVEKANKLFWSDEDLHKIESYDLETGSRMVIYQGGSEYSPTGMATYGGYLYWADVTKSAVYRIAIHGSETEPMEVNTAFDVGRGAGAFDLYFHKSGEIHESIGCGPTINFNIDKVGPICEGKTACVSLTNTGDRNGTVNITTTDVTAIGGDDYEEILEELTIPAGETVTFTVDILADNTYPEPRKKFELTLAGEDLDTTTNDTVTVLIAHNGNNECYEGPAGYGGCGPAINFNTHAIGPVCPGERISVSLRNYGSDDGTVNVRTLDGTATGGEDYQTKNEDLTIPVGETATITVDVLAEGIDETEEIFSLAMRDNSEDEITHVVNSTVTVTIKPDNQCYGLMPAQYVKSWKTGFISKLSIPIKATASDWRLDLHLAKGVTSLKLRYCSAEVSVTKHLAGRMTIYTLRPESTSANLQEGDHLFVEYVGRTVMRIRGEPVMAKFIPF